MCGCPNVPGFGRQLCPRARLRTALRAGRTESFGFRWLRTQETCFFAASHPVLNDAHATGVGSRAQRGAGAVCAWRVQQIVKVPSPSLFGDSTTQHKEGAHTPHTLQAACISPLVPPTRSQPRPGDEATGHRPPAETGHVSAHCHLPTNSRRSDHPSKYTKPHEQHNEASLMQLRGERPWHGGVHPTVTPSRPAL